MLLSGLRCHPSNLLPPSENCKRIFRLSSRPRATPPNGCRCQNPPSRRCREMPGRLTPLPFYAAKRYPRFYRLATKALAFVGDACYTIGTNDSCIPSVFICRLEVCTTKKDANFEMTCYRYFRSLKKLRMKA